MWLPENKWLLRRFERLLLRIFSLHLFIGNSASAEHMLSEAVCYWPKKQNWYVANGNNQWKWTFNAFDLWKWCIRIITAYYRYSIWVSSEVIVVVVVVVGHVDDIKPSHEFIRKLASENGWRYKLRTSASAVVPRYSIWIINCLFFIPMSEDWKNQCHFSTRYHHSL